MQTADFDFHLPADLVAQAPAPRRDQSRLLVLHRASGQTQHRRFPDLLHYLRPGDVLVLNNSRVIPARLRGVNRRTGGQFELLLLRENAPNDWWTLMRPGKRARVGTEIVLKNLDGAATKIVALVTGTNAEGHRRLRFSGTSSLIEAIDALGEVPLPPYIKRDGSAPGDQDRERYQTVFAQPPGSVAAPTAGLHFTEAFLDRIRQLGVHVCFVTLHVGLGTFAPVKTENLASHPMHEERFLVEPPAAQLINEAKQQGRRIIAVGTTTVRVLESVAASHGGRIVPGAGDTRIFLYPPCPFNVVDALLTNFHLPRSTLLMLVSAFAAPGATSGRDVILSAYTEAVRERYRFFSYGDAMFIL